MPINKWLKWWTFTDFCMHGTTPACIYLLASDCVFLSENGIKHNILPTNGWAVPVSIRYQVNEGHHLSIRIIRYLVYNMRGIIKDYRYLVYNMRGIIKAYLVYNMRTSSKTKYIWFTKWGTQSDYIYISILQWGYHQRLHISGLQNEGHNQTIYI